MAKDKGKSKADAEELSVDEAANIVQKLSKPDRQNEEFELLKKASATLLGEVKPGFEFEEDEDDGGSGGSKIAEELAKPPGTLEQIGTQLAALGPAGVIALSSAAYFQVDTVVEETRVVQQVAEEKWEEVKFEHPNINWDDPLAGFTTILGMGDIEIDLDPPTLPAQSEPKETNEPSTLPKGTESNGEETQTEEVSEEPAGPSDKSDTKDEDSNEETIDDEEKEEPKKKKKGFFSKLLTGDDEEEAEEEQTEEEPESEPESEPEPEAEAEEESSEPEPEAEEEQAQEEKPKKKSGGLFSALFGGGDDEESEEPEDEQQGEPTQDDTIPDEQAEEKSTEEPETETTESEVDGTEPAAEPVANADTAESNGVESKKSSGGGLLSLFGFNNNEKEVVEENEISADEEPAIEIAAIDSESEAPPISTDDEVEVEVDDISIDEMDDIKPHTMVTETEIEVAPEVEVEVAEIDIADVLINADVVIDDIEVDAGIEIANIDDVIEETVIEKVLTPIDATVVSPAGPASDIDFADIFGPNAPGYDNGESDATPI